MSQFRDLMPDSSGAHSVSLSLFFTLAQKSIIRGLAGGGGAAWVSQIKRVGLFQHPGYYITVAITLAIVSFSYSQISIYRATVHREVGYIAAPLGPPKNSIKKNLKCKISSQTRRE